MSKEGVLKHFIWSWYWYVIFVLAFLLNIVVVTILIYQHFQNIYINNIELELVRLIKLTSNCTFK